MATGRSRILLSWLALAALAPAGCSQPGPFASRQTMVGSLKASVSQLEFENEKLRKEVGEMKADNSRLDNQLVQEREANGEITARLDDAKDLLRRQGGTSQAMGSSSRNFEDDDIPPPATTSPVRRSKSSRKPPAAQIPRIESTAPFGSSSDAVRSNPPGRTPRDVGPADRDDEDRWLPVARGLASPVVRQ